MDEAHEVISAFLDDEAFDPAALGDALADPVGRTLLIDLVALRHLTQADGTAATPVARRRAKALRALLSVAAILVALVSGYFAGVRQRGPVESAAPAPTRIVQRPPAWQVVAPERLP
jgi:hypothetical protein